MCYTTRYLNRYPNGITHSIIGTTVSELEQKFELNGKLERLLGQEVLKELEE